MNPSLQRSPFIDNLHGLSGDIIRFRLGSHMLPIETGRWSRTERQDRLCRTCNVLGDESHALFRCTAVNRDLLDLPGSISEIWKADDIFSLFKRLREANFLEWGFVCWMSSLPLSDMKSVSSTFLKLVLLVYRFLANLHFIKSAPIIEYEMCIILLLLSLFLG